MAMADYKSSLDNYNIDWSSNHASTAYMPYLTLWDKISQNLAHLDANSHKIF